MKNLITQKNATVAIKAPVVLALGFVIAGAGLAGNYSWLEARFSVKVQQTPETAGKANQAKAGSSPASDPLPDGAFARLGQVRLRHGSEINHVGFSHDGKMLLSADWHGVSTWDADTGRKLSRFGDPKGQQFHSEAFSADGRIVALTREEGEVEIWDAATAKLILFFKATRWLSAILSPNGKDIALVGNGAAERMSLALWDATTGQKRHQLPGPEGRLYAGVFSSDGKTLVTSHEDLSVRFWDVATGKQVGQLDLPEPLGRIVLAPDGKTLASVGAAPFANGWSLSDRAILWDTATGKKTHDLTLDENDAGSGGPVRQIVTLLFAPDGKTLLTSNWRHVFWWDVATGKELVARRMAPGSMTRDLAFAPDGKTLATGGIDCVVRLWDVATGKERFSNSGHESKVLGVAVSADGRFFATAGMDRRILLWDAATGKQVKEFASEEEGLYSVAFSPNGKMLVCLDFKGSARFWDIASGKDIRRISLSDFALAPDGRYFVTWAIDRTMHVWDTASGKEIRQWQVPDQGGKLAISNDSRNIMAWGVADKMVRVWEASSGKETISFPAHRFSVGPPERSFCYAFSPEGSLVAFAGPTNYAVIQSMTTGKEVKRISGLRSTLTALSFSPDGRIVAFSDFNGEELHLWELETGQRFRQLVGHHGPVSSLSFSTDSAVLLTGSADTTAIAWDLTGRHTGPQTRPLSAKDLEARWAELGSGDATLAQKAVRVLLAVPEQTLAFIEKELKPVKTPDGKLLTRLLTDLEADTFAMRERASADLEKLGEAAEPAMRKALEGQPALELRRRVERLLEIYSSSQRLRTVRAVQVIEQLVRPGSRDLLDRLAKGEPDARLTREATAAVKRLSLLGAGMR